MDNGHQGGNGTGVGDKSDSEKRSEHVATESAQPSHHGVGEGSVVGLGLEMPLPPDAGEVSSASSASAAKCARRGILVWLFVRSFENGIRTKILPR